MKKLIDKIRKVQTWRERVDIARDELPGTNHDEPPLKLSALELDPDQIVDLIFDLIIPGSKNPQDFTARSIALGKILGARAANLTRTEFANLVGVPRSSADRLWERLSLEIQGELHRFGKSLLECERKSESN